ncbi:MAG: UDP-3-O-(3-hydroxymyristoyl)glucosamine N-acyltransferase [Bacteroidales bacterium]|nr:UDP-3-O-(3-hydroxymyristoyl)glucosamine N-acyltransferase [Bacteroidales bacterium]
MKFSAKQIAEVLNGKIEGNPDITVNSLSKIEEGKIGTLSFLANPKYNQYIYKTNASIVIVNSDFIPEKEITTTLIKVENAYSAFASLLEMYNEVKLNKSGVSDQAFISASAQTGKDIYIGEFAYIGENAQIGDNVKIYPQAFIGDNVKIGDNSTVFASVKIYSDCIIGKDCTIHAGVVIGGDGFGFAPQNDKNYKKVAQIGNVIIEDFVEIGANTTIDRATLGSTILRRGVKLDNLIQVAHNVEIGENTVIAALTGISGSSKIGKNCMIAGQVGISGHIEIADEVKIGAQSGVSSSVKKKGAVILGSPAFDISKSRKSIIHYRNFDRIIKRLEYLEEKFKK